VSKHNPNFPSQTGATPPQRPQPQTKSSPEFAVIEQRAEFHSGPLPPPQVIEGYEKILPGAADRIITMAELEQRHQHQAEVRNQKYRGFLAFVGQLFGLAIGLSGIGGGVFLASHDKSLVGFGVFFSSLAALVGVFIFQKRKAVRPISEPNK
jgi:uncharacterized membrane protein